MMPGHDGRRRRARAQPAAGRDGRHRRPAADEAHPHQAHQHLPRRALHRPAQDRQAAAAAASLRSPTRRRSTSSARATCRSSALDPALTRPGRMGRHIYFRTPTWEDRRDIFDLYLGKVAHDAELDKPRSRDELARITNGYSPAMIDQVCSMALTYAHSDGREFFERADLARGDDDGRVGRRHRPALPQARGALDRRPRGGPRRLRAPVRRERDVDAALDPQARLLGRPPPGDADRGPLRRLALRAGRRADLERSARWRPSTSSTARTRPASAATSARRRRRRAAWSASPAMAPDADRPLRPDRRQGAPRGGGGARDEALREARRRRSCTAPAAA